MNNISKFCVLFLIIILSIGTNNFIYAQSPPSSEVKIIKDSDLKLLLEESKGSPLLINVWATWCAPCREEFPELVSLSENYNSKVKFIGISVDDVDVLNSKVIPFLKDQNAKFDNYLLKVSDPEDFINVLNKDWNGAIPATFLYDKNGKQKTVLIGMQSYKEFENAIKKVID